MRFSLITEGVSENRILKWIISQYFKDTEIFYRDIQPEILDNGKQDGSGGWLEVLKICARKDDLSEALRNSDYLVIQIDSDMSENKHFDVKHQEKGKSKTCEELLSDIRSKLESLIDSEILKTNSDKIIFSICIHSTECWLLPIIVKNKTKEKTLNCLETLNKELAKQNKVTIPKAKNSTKANKAYENILKNWKKRKDIIESSESNCSFKNFIAQLDTIAKKIDDIVK